MPSPESIERETHLEHTREILHLAEQVSQGGLKVLPGKSWALHYPENGAVRNATLRGLLAGTESPEGAAEKLKPDALIYDVSDIPRLGLDGMTARVRELSATAAHGDYVRFASFVSSMQGKEIDLETIQTLYDGVTQSRTRGKLLDSYGTTGRKQMETAMRQDAAFTMDHFGQTRGIDRVLQACKMQWMERRNLALPTETNAIIDSLHGAERTLFEALSDAYASYADRGDQESFDTLQQLIQQQLPAITDVENQMSPSMEKLKEELKDFMEPNSAPGTPGDKAIPPDDSDEYHTPPPTPGDEAEKGPAQSIFEIKPAGTNTKPVSGYFPSGRKSYYDRQTKTWSKRKKLTPYSTSVTGDHRWNISGQIDGELKSIPIPAGHCLDASSIQWSGAKPEIFRDQKGCFYLQPSGPCSFSVDFLREDTPFTEPPIAEDLEALTDTPYESDAKQMLQSLSGSSTEKASEIVRHVRNKHFYPGGGDLSMAQALQHKLRTQSAPDEYIHNLETSEYLECYSSNTLFVSYCRAAGIPARLVIGHKTDGARNGSVSITTATGHAWSEFWDGQSWRRIDATPPPKPEDKKKENDNNPNDSSPSDTAQDEGIENEPDQKDITDQVQDRIDDQLENVQNQRMGQAEEADVSEGESSLEKAKEMMDKMGKRQKELRDRIRNAESFQELEDLGRETEESDLFDDMKDTVRETKEAKEKQMKEEMTERIDAMEEDGFIDDDKADELRKKMENASASELDEIRKAIDVEQKEHEEFETLREQVRPLVEHWYKYFVEHLPKQSEIDVDDSQLARRGIANRRAMMRPGALLFGKIRNPRVFKPSVKPRFIASILVDVSASMEDDGKLAHARKLLVFYSELFSKISREFGYIRFAINTFSDSVHSIKKFDQDYDARDRHDYDGETSTVKVRLMRGVKTQGGTNMLDALKKSSEELDEQKREYEDHVSALYFIGDGGDTCGNTENIKKYLSASNQEGMYGDHMKSAILLGTEKERKVLSHLFGEERTTVAGNFETLVEQSMTSFADDIEAYCDTMVA